MCRLKEERRVYVRRLSGTSLSGNDTAIRRNANAIIIQQPLTNFLWGCVELIGCHGFHNSHLVLSNPENMALIGFGYFRKKYDAVSLLAFSQ